MTDNTTDSPTEPAPTVWACLNYADAPAAIEFLVALGFRSTLTVPGDGDGVVAHAELRWPEGGGVMLGSNGRNDSEFSDMPTGTGSVYVVTAEPSAVHERAVGLGAKIVRPMEETDYGSKQFAIADAEGNLWCFGTYAGEA